MWNNPIRINTTAELYAIQHEILNLLICTDTELHIVDAEHGYGMDRLGFENNSMGHYKCILIPSTLKNNALLFVNIIQNVTKRTFFLCCLWAPGISAPECVVSSGNYPPQHIT